MPEQGKPKAGVGRSSPTEWRNAGDLLECGLELTGQVAELIADQTGPVLETAGEVAGTVVEAAASALDGLG